MSKVRTLFSSGTATLFRSTATVAANMAVLYAALAAVAVITARVLGPTERGVLVLAISIGGLSSVIASIGVNYAGRVQLAVGARRTSMNAYLGLSLVLVALEFLLCFVAESLILRQADSGVSVGVVVAGALYGAAYLWGMMTRDALYAIGQSRNASFLFAFGSLISLAAILILVVAHQVTLPRVIGAITMGSLVEGACGFRCIAAAGYSVRPRTNINQWRSLLREGAPAVTVSLSQAAAERSDRLLVGMYLSSSAVGIYAAAATISQYLCLLAAAMAQALFQPVAARTVDRRSIRNVRRFVLAATAASCVVLFLASRQAVRLVLGEPYAGAVVPLRILLLGGVPLAAYYVDVYTLVARNMARQAGIVAFTGLVVVILLNVAFVRPLGINGAAWASTASYWCMAIMAYRFVRTTKAD